MMRKVVNNRNAVDHRAHLKPPLHALEAGQRGLNRGQVNPQPEGQCRGSSCIECIVLARQAHFKLSPWHATMPDFPAHQLILMAKVREPPVGAL